MENKKFISIMLLFVVMLLSISLVSAQLSDSFVASSSLTSMQVCSCSTLYDSISVTNTGSFVGSYTIKIEGVGAEYSTLSDSILILEPGQTGSVENIIDLPCDKYGTLDLKIKVISNTGSEEVIPLFLDVRKCSNNKFEFINGNSFTNIPCSTTRYDAMLSNIGQKDEIYDLSVEGIPREYVTFTENPVLLSSGEKKHIIALVNMPCEEYGSFEGEFISTARQSDIQVSLPFYLGIKREYNFSVSFGEYVPEELDDETVYSPKFPEEVPEYFLCEGVASGIPVKVSNDVFISNTYLLSEGSREDWVGIDKEELNIHGFEEGYFNIVIAPEDGDAGSYEVPISIESVRGDYIFDYNIPYTVEDCTSFTLDMKSYDETCCGVSTYTLTVRNTGSKDNVIELKAPNNNTWLSEYDIDIKSGEERDIEFTVYKPCDEKLDSDLMKVNAKVKGDILEERETAIELDYVSSKQCHALSFSKGYEKVFYEYREKPLKIKNTGIKASEYQVYAESPDWITLSDYNNFSLEPGETRYITINYAPDNTTQAGIYNLTLNVMSDNGYTHVHTIYSELKVKTGREEFMQFLEENKVLSLFMILVLIALIVLAIYLITLIQKNEKKRVPKAPKFVKEKKTKEVNKTGKKSARKEVKETSKTDFWKWAFFFLLAVIILFIVISLTYTSTGNDGSDKESSFFEKSRDYVIGIFESPSEAEEPDYSDESKVNDSEDITENVTEVPSTNLTDDADEIGVENETEVLPEKPYEERLYDYLVENNLTDSFQYQIWSMNNVHELNLSPYFVDPDGDDELVFTSTTPRFVTIDINGSVAYLTPDEGWKGVDYVTFKATDKTGAYVITPEVALVVREKHAEDRPLSEKIMEFLNKNLMYIVFGVIILIIVIMILTAGSSSEKK